ncbi:MAG: hypothetical protein AAF726_00745 [Planctomycetota bacterium]
MSVEDVEVRAGSARTKVEDGPGTSRRWPIAWLALAASAAGCSDGTSALFGPAPDGATTSSVTYDFDNDGPVVARLRLPAPAEEDFLLRATVPVPEQMHFDGASQVPFAVISSSDPTASITQVETVTRYADDGQGSDVVEILSHVRRPGVAPGTEIEYDVVLSPHTPSDFELAPSVESLVGTADAIRLTSQDPFGNRYEMDPLQGLRNGDPDQRTLRQGPLVHEVAEVGALTPVEVVAGSQGTLPRLMGVTAYVRTFANEDYLALDLHVHNGYDGQDVNVDWDAALEDVYFRALTLRVPDDWVVLHLFDSPSVGDPQVIGETRHVPLVRAIGSGQMHVMHRQSQFVRRLMVARPHAVDRARSELEHRGLAFCVAGASPQGDELWSWWNPSTARYLPQNGRLPDLAGLTTRENVDAMYRAALGQRAAQLRDGTGANYPVQWGALGWAHPWGIQYGGMTGGDGIEQITGADMAWASSQEGYRFKLLRGRMSIERQPFALLASDGHPTRYEDHVVPSGINGAYLPFSFNMAPKPDDQYFGFDTSPTFQAEHCRTAGLAPGYENDLRGFMPHDLQHLIRFTADLYVLQWLGNDSLAKAQLRQAAELFRMTHHETYSGNYGYVPGLSLKFRQQRVLEHPGTGIEYGRGEGWGLHAAAGAYAAADDAFRGRLRPWFAEVARVVREGQSTCTGNITAIRVNKNMNGIYRTRQSFELSFTVNALESMRTSVFEDVDASIHATLGDTIVDAARSTLEMPFWDPAFGGQRKVVGVGMSDMSVPDFCASLPPNAGYGTTNTDYETPMTVWTYAYRISGDGYFLQRASESFGATGHLETDLEALGTGALIHSALLLGLMQELGGAH